MQVAKLSEIHEFKVTAKEFEYLKSRLIPIPEQLANEAKFIVSNDGHASLLAFMRGQSQAISASLSFYAVAVGNYLGVAVLSVSDTELAFSFEHKSVQPLIDAQAIGGQPPMPPGLLQQGIRWMPPAGINQMFYQNQPQVKAIFTLEETKA